MAKQARKKRRRPRRSRGRKGSRPKTPSPRAVEAALAGIAHDIRTPLTGIVALAELLVSSDLGAREREWANAIKSGADHLSTLTTVIVDAAKADAKGLVLRAEPFSPRALAEAVGAALEARGYHAQATPQEGSLALFHMNAGRQAIKPEQGGFRVGERIQPAAALLERARTAPEEFSRKSKTVFGHW